MLWWLLSLHCQAQEYQRTEVPIAIVGGMLLDDHEAPPVHHNVVNFQSGRITPVCNRDNTPSPKRASIIDAGGRTVMPGLIDAHIHIDLIGHGSYARLYEFMNGMERIEEFMTIAVKQMLRAGAATGPERSS